MPSEPPPGRSIGSIITSSRQMTSTAGLSSKRKSSVLPAASNPAAGRFMHSRTSPRAAITAP